MGTAVDTVINELKDLEYSPFVIETPVGITVFFEYSLPNGKYSGETVLLGISFQEQGYPEYPPHWVHFSPPYNNGLGSSDRKYRRKDEKGIEREFIALSRPPSDIWDKLPTKNMQSYLDLHIYRICESLK